MAKGRNVYAQLIYEQALHAGLKANRAKELVAAAMRESGLNPQARNKSSGAAGLFQLLSSGYVNRANAHGGVFNPRANIAAILPSYLKYWRQHPNAAPGAGAAAVEASGKGAAWYAQPLQYLPGYNLHGGGGSNAGIPLPGGAVGTPSPPSASVGRTLAQALIEGQDVVDILPQLRAARMAAQTPPEASVMAPNATQASPGGFTPAELFYRDMALKFGKHINPVKGHYDHVHAAYTNPQAVLAAIALAKRLGLSVGENPEVGVVHPVHVSDSYHYRKFPGKYHGRKLGEAIDVSGPQAAMLRFYQSLAGGR